MNQESRTMQRRRHGCARTWDWILVGLALPKAFPGTQNSALVDSNRRASCPYRWHSMFWMSRGPWTLSFPVDRPGLRLGGDHGLLALPSWDSLKPRPIAREGGQHEHHHMHHMHQCHAALFSREPLTRSANKHAAESRVKSQQPSSDFSASRNRLAVPCLTGGPCRWWLCAPSISQTSRAKQERMSVSAPPTGLP